MALKRTKAELERLIAVPAQRDSSFNKATLLSQFNGPSTVATALTTQYLREWLLLNGLPASAVAKALPESLVNAYNTPPYLRGWRKRVNPSWYLLGNDTDDIDTDAIAGNSLELNTSAPTAPVAMNPATMPSSNSAASNASNATNANKEWLQALFAQLETTTNKLVADKLAKTTLKLDDAAKAQIVALAQDAAQKRIDELAKPQVIEIVNHVNGMTQILGLQHERFPMLLRACGARDHRGFRLNIWLTGPTGSGKTTAGENVAKALSYNFGSDGSLDADYKVLGFRDANGHIVSTEFIRIYAEGGIYIADEIDNWMPSALLSLNAALANGWMTTPGGMIKRHPDACVIACANTWGLGATGDYVGRTRLDAASLDRFQPKIDWPYDERLERAVAEGMAGELGTEWHDIVRAARAKVKKQGLKIIVSPRATYNGIALLKAGFTPDEVIDQTFAAGISADQKRAIGVTSVAMNTTLNPPAKPMPTATTMRQIMGYLADGHVIDAIKVYRDAHNCDLTTARKAIEAMPGYMGQKPSWSASTLEADSWSS